MEMFLDSIIRGLITYRVGIYVGLGVGIFIYLRKFVIGLREWQKAVFGLERRLAHRKLVSALTGLLLLILLVIGEFMLVTVVGPQMPLETEPRLAADEQWETSQEAISDNEGDFIEENQSQNAAQDSLISECIEDVVEIITPEDGQRVSGTVDIIGTVNIDNFGSYKYEYTNAGTINWVTIAAGNQLKLNESIGFWYTSALLPGTYLLQIVPLNNVGEEQTPCIITVEVVPEE